MQIRVTNTINAADLFDDPEEVDMRRSCESLIQQTTAAWQSYLRKTFPSAQIEIVLRMNEESSESRNIVFVEYGSSIAYSLRNDVDAKLNEIALDLFLRSEWRVTLGA